MEISQELLFVGVLINSVNNSIVKYYTNETMNEIVLIQIENINGFLIGDYREKQKYTKTIANSFVSLPEGNVLFFSSGFYGYLLNEELNSIFLYLNPKSVTLYRYIYNNDVSEWQLQDTKKIAQ